MNKLNNIFITLFLAILLFAGGYIFLGPQRSFSENENRTLEQMPRLTEDGILKGKFQESITTYMCDQFPFRDTLTSLGTEIKKAEGKEDMGGAYLGDKGYYFEKILDKDIDEGRYRKNLKAIETMATSYESIPTCLMLVPSSSIVLDEYLPKYAKTYDGSRLEDIAKETLKTAKSVDLISKMDEQDDRYIYYKTDHHWTTLGAYYGYQALANNRGWSIKPYKKYDPRMVTDSFYGTLYSKALDPAATPDTIEAISAGKVKVIINNKSSSLYDQKALDSKDKYEYFLGGNFGEVRLTGECNNGKTLLLIKDSFANCFAPYLLNNYQNIIMIDLRYYGGIVSQLMLSEKIDEILFLYEMNDFANDSNISKLWM